MSFVDEPDRGLAIVLEHGRERQLGLGTVAHLREVDGRGLFTDTRNDHDGDGQPDTIDAWAKYDNIVELAERYGIQIQARLDNPPAWSRSDPNAGPCEMTKFAAG